MHLDAPVLAKAHGGCARPYSLKLLPLEVWLPLEHSMQSNLADII
jgi:hypothetical protein